MGPISPRRGASAIEFALILPVFVAIMFGVIEYGWVFFQQANVVAAVRDGARYGVTLARDADPDPEAGAEGRVRDQLLGLGFTEAALAGASIDASYEGDSPSEVLVVRVSVPYDPIIGVIPAPANLTGRMTMLLELQD